MKRLRHARQGSKPNAWDSFNIAYTAQGLRKYSLVLVSDYIFKRLTLLGFLRGDCCYGVTFLIRMPLPLFARGLLWRHYFRAGRCR